jgi:hypothetical protein
LLKAGDLQDKIVSLLETIKIYNSPIPGLGIQILFMECLK